MHIYIYIHAFAFACVDALRYIYNVMQVAPAYANRCGEWLLHLLYCRNNAPSAPTPCLPLGILLLRGFRHIKRKMHATPRLAKHTRCVYMCNTKHVYIYLYIHVESLWCRRHVALCTQNYKYMCTCVCAYIYIYIYIGSSFSSALASLLRFSIRPFRRVSMTDIDLPMWRPLMVSFVFSPGPRPCTRDTKTWSNTVIKSDGIPSRRLAPLRGNCASLRNH